MRSWVVRRALLNLGPFSTDELREEIRGGAVTLADLVWADDTREWVPLASQSEFASVQLASDGPTAESSAPLPSSLSMLATGAPRKRSVWLMLLLTLLTLGFYPGIWLILTRKPLAALGTRSHVSTPLPVVGLALCVLAAVVNFWDQDLAKFISIVGGVLLLVQSFRVLAALREFTQRTSQATPLSGLLTFLLQAFYLQYKINRIHWRADV